MKNEESNSDNLSMDSDEELKIEDLEAEKRIEVLGSKCKATTTHKEILRLANRFSKNIDV